MLKESFTNDQEVISSIAYEWVQENILKNAVRSAILTVLISEGKENQLDVNKKALKSSAGVFAVSLLSQVAHLIVKKVDRNFANALSVTLDSATLRHKVTEITHISAANFLGNLKWLESKQIITAVENEHNRILKNVTLTWKGAQVIKLIEKNRVN